MAYLLICTGKKRSVHHMLDFFRQLDQQKKITIIAQVQTTKKAMIWNYEELKVLFEREEKKPLEIDTKLVRSVDFVQLRQPHGVVLKMSSFTSEDKELRWNIISRTTAFQLKGGRIDIREEINSHTNRTSRICHLTMAGPCNSLLSLKEVLIQEGFADPKTIEFLL